MHWGAACLKIVRDEEWRTGATARVNRYYGIMGSLFQIDKAIMGRWLRYDKREKRRFKVMQWCQAVDLEKNAWVTDLAHELEHWEDNDVARLNSQAHLIWCVL